jgi:chemotaxis protein CheX
MMLRELHSDDVTVFSEAIIEYFATTTGRKAEVRSAYLLDGSTQELWNDYNGYIAISGQYLGGVRFSAPREMLTHVLLAVGEREFTEERHRDLVGEIANTLSGRARRHFGEGLEIAPPQTFIGGAVSLDAGIQALPYTIPLTWHGYTADLVVQLATVTPAPR